MPSRLMLIIPARSTTTSPSAASASGVAVRTVASTNAEKGELIQRARLAADSCSLERDERENDGGFDDGHDDRRNAGVALHGRRARLERAEQNACPNHRGGVEPREQGDGNRGVPVAGRDVLVERVRHAGHFDGAGESRQCAADEKCAHRDALDVDSPGRSARRTDWRQRRADEIRRRCSESSTSRRDTPRSRWRSRREGASSRAKRGKLSRRDEGGRLRKDVRRFLERPAHEIRHEIARRRSSA